MSPPVRFLALVTRKQLTEMLAPTYAKARNVDPNEAYERLESALTDMELLQGVQIGIWNALIAKKPKLDAAGLIELAGDKLNKRKQWKPMASTRTSEGPLAALTVLIDRGSGFGTGEAIGLLDTPDGARILKRGFELIGAHLAAEILR